VANRRFVLVANDKSPSDALGKLGDALFAQGDDVIRFLGGGKLEATSEEIRETIGWGSPEGVMLIVGMSSNPGLSELELVALEAASIAGVKYGIYSDSFNAYRRSWFAKFRHDCSHLLLASAGELKDAQDLFPNAEVTVVGNPSWEDLINPNLSDDDIQKALGAKEVILVPGNKTHNTNVDLVRTVLTSVPLHKKMDGIRVVFAPHPGEIKQDPDAMKKYSQEIGAGLSEDDLCLLTFLPKGIQSKDVLRVAWATVSACSPTTDFQAALLGVPAFNYLGHPDTRARLMKEFESDIPELCAMGVVEKTMTPLALQEALNHDETAEELKVRQFAHFPEPPAPGRSVQLMKTALSLL
jgi:hypothetical protein